MPKRTRWPAERLARAAFLCKLGWSASRIAKDATNVSNEASVREHLYAIGLASQPEGQLERLVAVPVRHMPMMAAAASARGRYEMAEDVIAKVVAVLAEEPPWWGTSSTMTSKASMAAYAGSSRNWRSNKPARSPCPILRSR